MNRWVLLLGVCFAAGCGAAERSESRPSNTGDSATSFAANGGDSASQSSAQTSSPNETPSGGAAPGSYDPQAYDTAPTPAASGEAFPPRAAASPMTTAAPPEGQGSPDAPMSDRRAAFRAAPAEPRIPADPPKDHVVRVFYATDREPIDLSGGPVVPWKQYSYALLSGVLTLLAACATAFLPRKVVSATLAGGGLAATLYLGQFAAVRAQQLRRAADYGDRSYGSVRHETEGRPAVELGACEVSIPPDHRVGKVESPSVLRFEFREDPQKHVVLERVRRLPEGEFFDSLASNVAASDARQAFVFIHGYNVAFDDAVKRTAQIAYDLKFDGAAVCYSWPSQGGVAQYTRDEANVAWTVTQLETFLRDLAERSGARRIHLVAHSMGNRALTQALERLALKGERARFGQVVLAAPDVDAGEFRTRYAPALSQVARRVTLYASSNDRALLASTRVHGYTRAGLSGANLVVVPGLDTVDVSPIDTSLIGHSYYGDNPLMIRDLTAVLERDLPAEGRGWLRRLLLSPETPYWAFRDDLTAGRL
jgi:esterase/lipase superfamily enzyme